MQTWHQWRRPEALTWRATTLPRSVLAFRSDDHLRRDLDMKICVLGAGVIGLTTAWCLAEAGHDVINVDRHAFTTKDASAANGGQLSYAFVAPLASPATLLKLPSLLLSPDSPMRIRVGLDPALISWGARLPARLPAGGGARDHCRATRARRLEPERTGAAFPEPDAFVRTANRRQACGVPQQRNSTQRGVRSPGRPVRAASRC